MERMLVICRDRVDYDPSFSKYPELLSPQYRAVQCMIYRTYNTGDVPPLPPARLARSCLPAQMRIRSHLPDILSQPPGQITGLEPTGLPVYRIYSRKVGFLNRSAACEEIEAGDGLTIQVRLLR